MNEPDDRMLSELKALRPQKPSPRLRKRIERELAAGAAGGWGRRKSAVLVTVLGLAAGLLLAFFLWPRETGETARQGRSAPSPAVDHLPTHQLPTHQAYRRAWSKSPAAFDALLDQHAARPHRSSEAPMRASEFMSGHFDL